MKKAGFGNVRLCHRVAWPDARTGMPNAEWPFKFCTHMQSAKIHFSMIVPRWHGAKTHYLVVLRLKHCLTSTGPVLWYIQALLWGFPFVYTTPCISYCITHIIMDPSGSCAMRDIAFAPPYQFSKRSTETRLGYARTLQKLSRSTFDDCKSKHGRCVGAR